MTKTQTDGAAPEPTAKRRKPTAATGLMIAEFLARNPHGARLVDISAAIDMDRAQTHRMIAAMAADGWVAPVGDDGSYTLTARTIRMGSTFVSRLDLSEHARPFLDELSRQTRESVFVGELRRDMVICVGRRVADHSLRVWTEVGDAWPVEGSAVGIAIRAAKFALENNGALPTDGPDRPETDLDALSAALSDGYARDFGRYREGIQSVAAPILEASGNPVGAIALAGPRSRIDDGKIIELGQLVRETGILISERMGFHAR